MKVILTKHNIHGFPMMPIKIIKLYNAWKHIKWIYQKLYMKLTFSDQNTYTYTYTMWMVRVMICASRTLMIVLYEHNRITRTRLLFLWCPWKINVSNLPKCIVLNIVMNFKYFTFLCTKGIQNEFNVIKKLVQGKLLKYYDAGVKRLF